MARLNRCPPRCPPDSLSFASRGAPPAPLPTEPPGTAPPPAPAAGARRLRRGRPGRSLSACIRRAAAALRVGGAPEPASAPAPAPGPSAAPGGRRFAFARTSRGVAVFVRILALLAAVGAAVAPAHAQQSPYIEIWSATLTVGAAGRLRGYELGRYGALSEDTFTYAGREFQVETLTFFRNEGLTNAPDDDYLSIILSVTSADPVGTDRYLASLPFTYLYQIEAGGDQHVFRVPANVGLFTDGPLEDYPELVGLEVGDTATVKLFTPPAIESIDITSDPGPDRTYVPGDEVEATVTYNAAVNVSGTPTLTLAVGAMSTPTLAYASGSGSRKLIFTGYTVEAGDEDRDGISIEADSLSGGSGSIRSEALTNSGVRIDAVLLHNELPDDPGHRVDGAVPELVSAAALGGELVLGFDEPLGEGSVPTGDGGFTLTAGDGSTAPTVSGIAVRGRTVTAMLSAALDAGKTWTLAYAAPGTNAIEDAVGNLLADFSGEAVGIPRWGFSLTDVDDSAVSVRDIVEGGASIAARVRITNGVPVGRDVRVELTWGGAPLHGGYVIGRDDPSASAVTIPFGDLDGQLVLTAPNESDGSDADRAWTPPVEAVLVATLAGTETAIGTIALTWWNDDGVPPPAGLTATEPAALADRLTQVDLDWATPALFPGAPTNSAITGYRVERAAGPSGPWTEIGTPTAPTYADTSLTAATTWWYRVRSVSATGDSEPSNVVHATTWDADSMPAPPPQRDVPYTWNLRPAGVNVGDTFRLLFLSTQRGGGSSDIDAYNEHVRDDAAGEFTGHPDIRAYSSGFRVVGSTPTIDAVDNTATTGTGGPIHWLGGDKVADDNADFHDGSWSNEGDPRDVLGFSVASPGDILTGSTVSGTKSQHPLGNPSGTVGLGFLDDGDASTGPLHSNSTVANTESGRVYGLSQVFRVVESAPGKPVNLTAGTNMKAATTTATTIVLTWEPPENAGGTSGGVTGYRIERAPSHLGPWTVAVADTGATVDTRTMTGLTGSTTYWFRVRAINSAGVGDASDPASDTTGVGITIEAEPGPLISRAWDEADFTLTRTGDTTGALTVRVEVTESEDVVQSFHEGEHSVTFERGRSTAVLSVRMGTTRHDDLDNPGAAIATVLADDSNDALYGDYARYYLGLPSTAQVAVLGWDPDEDGHPMTLSLPTTLDTQGEVAAGELSVEEGEVLTFPVTARTAPWVSQRPSMEVPVAFTLSSRQHMSAVSDEDYDSLSTELHFPASAFVPQDGGGWVGTAQFSRLVTHDNTDANGNEFYEGDETLGVVIERTAALEFGIQVPEITEPGGFVTVTIVDDEAYPSVASIELTSDPGADGIYLVGEEVTATVTFASRVDVLGTDDDSMTTDGLPSVGLTIGTQTRPAACLADVATPLTSVIEVECGYTIVAGDLDPDGISIAASGFALNGGSIKATGSDPAIPADLANAAFEYPGHRVDTGPPVLEEALAVGSVLTLTFDEDLDEGRVPTGTGGFTLTASDSTTPPAVTSVAVDGRTVTATLASAPDSSKTWTLAYAVPGTNSIRDLVGHELAAFSAETIDFLVWEFLVDGGTSAVEVVEGGDPITATATITNGVTVQEALTVNLTWNGAPLGAGRVLGHATSTPTVARSAINIKSGEDAGSLEISAPDDPENEYADPETGDLVATFFTVEIGRVTLTWRDDELPPVTGLTAVLPSTLVDRRMRIDLAWDASTHSGVDGYRVERATDPDDPAAWAEVGETSGAATTTWTDTTVDPETTYYYRVSAKSGVRYGLLSNIAWATTNTAADKPGPLPVAKVPKLSVLVPPLLHAGDQFRLLFITSTTRAPDSTDIEDYNAHVRDAVAAGVEALRAYRAGFRVVGSTAAVSARENTGTTGTGGVPIYWLAGGKVADDYADFHDGDWNEEDAPTKETAPSLYDLDDFKTEVRTVLTGSNQDGAKHASAPLGATTVEQGVLDDATGSPLAGGGTAGSGSAGHFYALSQVLEVVNPVPGRTEIHERHVEIGATTARISWRVPEPNLGTQVLAYRVERRKDGVDAWTLAGTTAHAFEVSFEDRGLEPETTYHYRVRAVNAAGAGEPSNPVRVDTLAGIAIEGEQRALVANAWDDAVFTLTRHVADLAPALEVTVQVTQTNDYTDPGVRTVAFEPGAATTELRLELDGSPTADGTLTATVATAAGIGALDPGGATVHVKAFSPAMEIRVLHEGVAGVEGASVYFDVRARAALGAPAPRVPITVDLRLHYVTATARPGEDYEPPPKELTLDPDDYRWQDGRWTQTRRVPLHFLPDDLDEGDEQFALILESDLRGGIEVVDSTPRGSDYETPRPGYTGTDSVLVTISDVGVGTLAAALATNDTATLSWTASPSSRYVGEPRTGYEYRRKVGSGTYGDWTPIPDSAALTTHDVSGLGQGATHTFQLRAVHGFLTAPPSNEASVTTVLNVPGKPRNLTIDQPYTTGLRLIWDHPAGNAPITHYEYRQKETEGGAWGEWIPFKHSLHRRLGECCWTTPSLWVGNLTLDTRYTFQLQAVNGAGSGTMSDEVSRTPVWVGGRSSWSGLEASLRAVRNPPPTPMDATSTVTLSWNVISNVGLGAYYKSRNYEWRSKVRGGSWTSWATVAGGDSTSTVTPTTVYDMDKDYEFAFRLKLVSKNDNVAHFEGGSFYLDAVPSEASAPSPPRNLVARRCAQCGQGSLELVWDPPETDNQARITHYEMRYRVGKDPDVPFSDWITLGGGGGRVTFKVTGLEANATEHAFELRAVNAGGASGASNVAREYTRPVLRGFSEASDPGEDGVYSQGEEIVLALEWDTGPESTIGGVKVVAITVDRREPLEGVRLVIGGRERVARLGAPLPNGVFTYRYVVQSVVEDHDPSGVLVRGGRLDFGDLGGARMVTCDQNCVDDGVVVLPNLQSGNPASLRYDAVKLPHLKVDNRPSAPRNLTAEAGGGMVTLRWELAPLNGAPLLKYQYRHSEDNGVTWNPWQDVGAGEATSVTVQDLDAEKIHAFEVRAYSHPFPRGTATHVRGFPARVSDVGASGQVGAPGNLVAEGSATSVTLTWTPPVVAGVFPIDFYQLRYRASGDAFGDWARISGPTTTRHTVTGLDSDTRYTFELRAVTTELEYGHTATVAAETAAPPSPPREVAVDPIASAAGAGPWVGEVYVRWKPPLDDGGSPITRYFVSTEVPGLGGLGVQSLYVAVDENDRYYAPNPALTKDGWTYFRLGSRLTFSSVFRSPTSRAHVRGFPTRYFGVLDVEVKAINAAGESEAVSASLAGAASYELDVEVLDSRGEPWPDSAGQPREGAEGLVRFHVRHDAESPLVDPVGLEDELVLNFTAEQVEGDAITEGKGQVTFPSGTAHVDLAVTIADDEDTDAKPGFVQLESTELHGQVNYNMPVGEPLPRDAFTVANNDVVPLPPASFAAAPSTTLTIAAVDLTWDAPGEGEVVDGYEYRFSDDDGATWSPGTGTDGWADVPMSADGEANRTSYTITEVNTPDLMASTEYTFELRGENTVGAGEAASVRGATLTTPTAVTELRAEPGADGSMVLTWDALLGNPRGGYEYRFEEGTSVSSGITWTAVTPRDDVPPGRVGHLVQGPLTTNTQYTFEVRGSNTLGMGSPASVTARAFDLLVTVETVSPDGGYGAYGGGTRQETIGSATSTMMSMPEAVLVEGGASGHVSVKIEHSLGVPAYFPRDLTVSVRVRRGDDVGSPQPLGSELALVASQDGGSSFTLPAGMPSGRLAIRVPDAGGPPAYRPRTPVELGAEVAARGDGSDKRSSFGVSNPSLVHVVDDDGPPVMTLAGGDVTVNEGDGFTVDARLSIPYTEEVTTFVTPGPGEHDVAEGEGREEGSFDRRLTWRAGSRYATALIETRVGTTDSEGTRSFDLRLVPATELRDDEFPRGVRDLGLFTLGRPSSVTVTVLDDDTLPSAPANLVAVPGDPVTLLWTGAADEAVAGYEFRVSPDGGTNWIADLATPTDLVGGNGGWMDVPGESGATSVQVGGLDPGTTYTFEVRATNAAGSGPASSVTASPGTATWELGLSRDTLREGEPAVTATLTMTGGVTLSQSVTVDLLLSEPSSDPMAESVFRPLGDFLVFAGGDAAVTIDTGSSSGSVELRLADDDTYFPMTAHELLADLHVGGSMNPRATLTLVDDEPAPVATLRAPAAPDPGEEFPISVDLTRGFTAPGVYGEPVVFDALDAPLTATTTEFVIVFARGETTKLEVVEIKREEELERGYTEYKLRAPQNPLSFTLGEPSQVKVSLRGGAPPGAPTGLRAAPGAGRVDLTWDPPPPDGQPVVNYEHRRSQDGINWTRWQDVPDSGHGGANRAGFTVEGLVDGTSYTFQVLAENAAGPSRASMAFGTPMDAAWELALAPGSLTEGGTTRATLTITGGTYATDQTVVLHAGGKRLGETPWFDGSGDTIVLAAEATSVTATLRLADDDTFALPRTLTLDARHGHTTVASADLAITDDDRPPTATITARPEAVREGDDLVFALALTRGFTESVTVGFEAVSTAPGFAADVGSAFAVAAGERSATVRLPAEGFDTDEDITVTLTLCASDDATCEPDDASLHPSLYTVGSPSSATVTVVDDEGSPNPLEDLRVEPVVGTLDAVRLTWDWRGLGPPVHAIEFRYVPTVPWLAGDTTLGAFAEEEVTWYSEAGDRAGFTVDSLVRGRSYTFQVRAKNDEGVSALRQTTGSAVVEEWSFTLTGAELDGNGNPKVVEGGATVTATAAITNGVTFPSDVTVELYWGGTPVGGDDLPGRLLMGAGGAGAITITSGASSGSLVLAAKDDAWFHPAVAEPLAARFFGVEIRGANDAPLARTLAWENDEGRPTVTIDGPRTVVEGEDIAVTVTLTQRYTAEGRVEVAIDGDAGTLDATSTTATVDLGDLTSASHTVRTVEDMVANECREVTFEIVEKPARYARGEPDSVTVKVLDDDTPPAAPTGLEARAGDELVTLTWNPPPECELVEKYEYRFSDDDGATWSPGPGTDGWADVPMSAYGEANRTSYTVASLQNQIGYAFDLRGANSFGPSAAQSVLATPVKGIQFSFGMVAYEANEGESVQVTVVKEVPAGLPDEESVTVPIVVTPGEGLEGSEYSGVPATVTFPPGEDERAFTVTFGVDANYPGEGDETLTLALREPEAASEEVVYVLAEPLEAVLTVRDVPPPTVTFSFELTGAELDGNGNPKVVEGGATVTATAAITNAVTFPSDVTVELYWGETPVGGDDLPGRLLTGAGAITIRSGESSGSLVLAAKDDDAFYPAVAEALVARFSGVEIRDANDAPFERTLAWEDDEEPPTVTIEGPRAVVEGDDITVTVTLTKRYTAEGRVKVMIKGDAGTLDSTTTSTTATVELGEQTSEDLTRSTVDDTTMETGCREVSFAIVAEPARHVRGEPGSVTVKVLDDDTSPSAPEGLEARAGDELVTLTWNPPPECELVEKYEYRFSDDDGATWSPGPGTDGWADVPMSAYGEANRTSYTVASLQNQIGYAFDLRGANSFGPSAAQSVLATPVKGIQFSFGMVAYEANEGESVQVTVVKEVPAGLPDEESVTVPIVVTPGEGLEESEYSGVPATVTFPADETEQVFTVTFGVDANHPVEGDETLTLALGEPEAASEEVVYVLAEPLEAVLTVRDVPPPTVTFSFELTGAELDGNGNPKVVEGGATVTATAAITNAVTFPSDVTVELYWGETPVGGDELPGRLLMGAGGAGAITIRSGESSGSLVLAAKDDDAFYPAVAEALVARFSGVEIRDANDAPFERTLAWEDDEEPPTVTIEGPRAVVEGDDITVTVTLTKRYTAEGRVKVMIKGDAGTLDSTTTSTTATVELGEQTSEDLTRSTVDDTTMETGCREVSFAIVAEPARHVRGEPGSVTVKVLDDDTSPSAPEGLEARAGDELVTLTWNPPPECELVEKYEYRFSNDDGATWSPGPGTDGWADVPMSAYGEANRTSYTVESLQNQIGYAFDLRGANSFGPSAAQSVLATPVKGIQFSFGMVAYEANEGESVQVTVVKEVPAGLPDEESVTVPIVVTPGEGLEGSEYSGVPATVTFPPGEDERAFTVTFGVDANYPGEGDETLTLALREPEAASEEVVYVVAEPLEAVLTVRDVPPPTVTASFAKAAATAREGESVEVVVNLDRLPWREVVLELHTNEGEGRITADDYSGVPETVRFGPDETEQRFTVEFLRDTEVEGDETLVLELVKTDDTDEWVKFSPDRKRMELTIEDVVVSERVVRAWIARFGRTVTGTVVDAVEGRMEAPRARGKRASVAGQMLPLGGGGAAVDAGAEGRAALDAVRGWMAKDGARGGGRGGVEYDELGRPRVRSREVTGRDFLTGTSFSFTDGSMETGGFASFWGEGAIARFEGREDDLTVDGEVKTGLLGVDWVTQRWTAGVALSHSSGTGGYGLPGADGDFEAQLTGLFPYAGLDLTGRLSAWVTGGAGTGELTMTPEGGAAVSTNLAMTMGAVGVRNKVPVPTLGGVTFDIKGDARFTRTSTQAVREAGLGPVDADVWLIRTGVEGTRRVSLGGAGGATLTPSFEVGFRFEGGNAERGRGVEVGGGVRFDDPASRIKAAARVRGLFAHQDADYSEWGASGSVRIEPGASGRGLSLRVAPRWGEASSGTERLWSLEDASGLAPDGEFEAQSHLDAELGYGLPVFGGRGVATPHAGWSRADARETVRIGKRLKLGPSQWSVLLTQGAGRTWRAGMKRELAPDATWSLEGTREEKAGAGAPVNTITLRSAIRW